MSAVRPEECFSMCFNIPSKAMSPFQPLSGVELMGNNLYMSVTIAE
jgi:hypothetical protein